ncbi:hypothetical protein AB0I53_43840 [Saccharopolyspora sp. NPDC050389]|uniref:hypothetical protein n=1 Tax=Saccharopolyspora sp. NPDC050389 TaxID=3155516 RepID=UPI0033D0A49A
MVRDAVSAEGGSVLPRSLGRVGVERHAQPAHPGIAVVSDWVVLLGDGPGVFGFGELDRTHRARATGAPAESRFRVGDPVDDRQIAVPSARVVQ